MKSIFIPYDFTDGCNLTLQYAIAFVKGKNIRLILFHAFYDSNLIKLDDVEKNSIMELEINNKIGKLKNEVKEAFKYLNFSFPLNHIEFVIAFGNDTVNLINKEVAKKNSDLIIIGTYGVKGFMPLLMQSHAIQLIATSKVAVLVIPIGYTYKLIKNIFYATDLLHTPLELTKLIKLNELFNSELKIIYLDNGIAKTKTELSNMQFIETSGLKFYSIKFNIGSHIAEYLSDFLKDKKNSIFCLFHSQKNRLLTIIVGSNTNELLSHLKFPILSINKE